LKIILVDKSQAMIEKDEFLLFFNNLIENITSHMPMILKILLRLVHQKVNTLFTIEKSNYGPILTLLFFNFFISPRIQEIHNISPLNYPLIRTLNRILRVLNNFYNRIFVTKQNSIRMTS